MESIRFTEFTILLSWLARLELCISMTTSGLTVSSGCDKDLLPKPMSCRAAFLPVHPDDFVPNQLEVEMSCSWNHEYPIDEISFKYGSDAIQAQLSLPQDKLIISRRILSGVTEGNLSSSDIFCESFLLHPLCGEISQRSPCSTLRADVRVDPLAQDVGVGRTATVTCLGRDGKVTRQSDVTWRARTNRDNQFEAVRNTSRIHVTPDGEFILTRARNRDNMTTLNCSADWRSTTQNYGLSLVRVVELPPTTLSTSTRLSSTTKDIQSTISKSTTRLTSRDVYSTSTEAPIPTSREITTSLPRFSFFMEFIHIIVPTIGISVVLLIFICIACAIVRCRLKRKVVAPSAESAPQNVNDYTYSMGDDTIEHEYFQSCTQPEFDARSQRSEYMNSTVMETGHGRANRMLRSTSDSRLAMAAAALNAADEDMRGRTKSLWALPGMSTPQIPQKSRSRPVSTYQSHDCFDLQEREHGPRSPEYASIDEDKFARSLNSMMPDSTQPYACTRLHSRSHTMDSKLFVPKRKQKR